MKKKRDNTEIEDYAQHIVDPIPLPILVLDPDFQIVSANNCFLMIFQTDRKSTVGRSIAEIQDSQWNIPALLSKLNGFLEGDANLSEFEISHNFRDIGNRSLILITSYLEVEDREEKLILLCINDITRYTKNRKNEENYLKKIQEFFMQAPAAIAVVNGPDHVYTLSNPLYQKLFSRTREQLIGKRIREVFPEISQQGIYEVFDRVFESGEAYVAQEFPAKFDRMGQGVFETGYFNFIAHPIKDTEGNVTDIMIHAFEVTEQILARKKVEESEQQVRSLIESAPFPIGVFIGEELKLILANQAIINTWGKGKNIIGKSIYKVLLEEEDQQMFQQMQNVLKTGRSFFAKNQKFMVHNDGVFRPGFFNYSITPLYNETGEVYGVMNTGVDVTDLTLAKKKIEQSEKRFQEMIHSSPNMIATFKGEDLIIEIANDAILEAWGKDRSVIGKPLFSVLPEIVEQGFGEILQGVLRTGKPYKSFEMPVKLFRNGKMDQGYFSFIFYAQKDAAGNNIGVFHIATEVTPQAELNKKVKESESHFRQMADLIPGKIINADSQGNAIYFNQHWYDDTGKEFEELKDRGWQKMIHPDDFDQFITHWKKSLKTGKEFETEFRFLNKSGVYKWQLGRAIPVKDDSGKIRLWINSAIEIQKLKEEEKRKEDFLKMVSHELKTPVTSIKGYIQLLLSLLNNNKNKNIDSIPIKPSLERMDNQIIRLTRLISEMLDLSRLEENKLELKKEIFCINDLVNETVQDISFTNTQHRVLVSHDFRCNIYADKDRIGQVLINFITNAIKYSPENKEVEVLIKKSEDGFVSVSIKDRGIGIDRQNFKRIFKRFYRIGGRNEETYSGFGIGLYLANEIVQRHKGSIKVESELGEGSVFTFNLPYETDS